MKYTVNESVKKGDGANDDEEQFQSFHKNSDDDDGTMDVTPQQISKQMKKGDNCQELDESLAPSDDHIFLTWHDINFSVPQKQSQRQSNVENNSITHRRTSMIEEHIQKMDGKPINWNRKTILHDLSGYAKPGKMMAIMGASGSGKTSFLNVLGQRLGLSRGGRMSGTIRCNDRVLQDQDFGKFGAFVQQDDILLETFTPYECFQFAARLRTNLSEALIEDKIQDLIKRLGLQNCQDTKIGGVLVKGISGGERKRSSIGYELITDPNLLLCDEPTSGLDSSTAHRIIKMLKKEAQQRNTTIICTIHQPSSEIFNLFDRLLLLQDGHQIYQGQINEIPSYLENHLRCKMKRYQNPADFLIRLAQAPHRVREDLSLEDLVSTFKKVQLPQIELGMDERRYRYQEIDTNFNRLSAGRRRTFCIQFKHIFVRNWLFLTRNKRAMLAVIFNSFFVSLMMLAVFHNSCKPIDFSQYDLSDKVDRKRAIRDFNVFLQNTRGAAFMFQNQLSLSASINVILQMPMQLPVMKRELANKMYSPSAYYLGRFTSNMIIQIAYPVIMIFCTFYFLGIDTSSENLGMFLTFGIVSNFVFCGQGFCLGILVPDEDAVKIVNILIVMVLIAVCGTVSSLDTANWFIKGLSYVSPSRYNCEAFTRRILHNLPENPFVTEQYILDKQAYNAGDTLCLTYLVCTLLFWVILSLVAINLKFKKL